MGNGRRLGTIAAPIVAMLAVVAGCQLGARKPETTVAPPPPVVSRTPFPSRFVATAYTIEGTTASGKPTRAGTCAADLDVLPLGTRIRVQGAGRHSGEYVVRDTGRKITGRKLDLYIADDAEAKRFGRKEVSVEVLRYGTGG
ncbi:MAG TPA: 3D domain-containing protein [Candidatus Binatia bacterium]|jgi:3D (Asp-Asp-Asp) domain-containing protein